MSGKNDLEYQRNLELRAIVRKLSEGGTPFEIAELWPEIFILKSEGIIQLYQHLNKKQWRWKD